MLKIPFDNKIYKLFYHGSPDNFDIADTTHSKKYKDFGSGFYLGPHYGPAKDWALNYGARSVGYVHYYIVPIDIYNKFNSYRFQKASENWLDFVIANRNGKIIKGFQDYDFISGDTADAHAQALIDDYTNNIKIFGENHILKKQLLYRLHTENLPYQVCIKTESCLKYFQKLAVVEVRNSGQEIRRY